MSAVLRALVQVAGADLRERMRRTSFLAAVAGAVYFGYLIEAGYVSLTVERQRGIMSSAWVGILTAQSLALVLPLFGFYLVKNTLERDRRTGVGEILAASPLGNLTYAAGKALSNLAVLAALALVPAAGALLLQLTAGEERHLALGALLSPLVSITLPPLALVAAVAVLFETLPWLRGAFGNVAFFIGWNVLLVAPLESGARAFDVMGLSFVRDGLYRSLGRPVPTTMQASNMSLQIGPDHEALVGSFHWRGLLWTWQFGMRIAAVLGVALAVVAAAAMLSDRFDPARRRPRRARRRPDGAPGAAGAAGAAVVADADGAAVALPGRPRRALLRLPHWSPGTSFGGLVVGELRLMVEGRNAWWTLAALGLLLAGWLAPLEAVRDGLLQVAWLWPLALWSEMGAREARNGTGPLVFCGPWPPAVHALAIWCAGVLVTAVAALGPGVRLAAAGDARGALAWAAACAFIPSLALALGSWSGSTRLFEIAYLSLWYIGPINHAAGLDFMGVTAAARAAGSGWLWLGLAAVLLAAGIAGRRRLAQS